MNNQKGFVLTRGMIIALSFVVLAFVLWLLTQNTSQQAQQPTEQVQQQVALTPEEQQAKDDSQIKEDLLRTASAVSGYVADHSGEYPQTAKELDDVLTLYIFQKPFLSPVTQSSYKMTSSSTREQGTINLLRGSCNAEQNDITPTENTRTYAVLTQLTDKSVYCVDV